MKFSIQYRTLRLRLYPSGGDRMTETLMQDLRYSVRLLRRSPVFTIVSILALAIGIGANTAIFSMVNAILVRELPFKNPERLVWIWGTRIDFDKAFFSIPDFIDYRDQNQSLEDIAAYANWGTNLTDGGEPERLQGARISTNAFQMMGVNATLGRLLLPGDESQGSHTVVLSYGLWQRRFAGDRNIVDRTIILNGDSYTIVGVLPQTFIFPGSEAELAVPLIPETDARRTERGSNFLRCLARLKAGYTYQQAEADLNSICGKLRELYPATNAKHRSPRVFALQERIVGDYQLALYMLLGTVGLVLLIACSNLANLLLARASARHKEMAIRAALGASRPRLIRQMLTETGLLALMGGAVGLILAWQGSHLLLTLSPTGMPRAKEISIDIRVLLFTLVVSMLAGVIFGLLPAMHASKIELNEELKSSGKGTNDQGRRTRARNFLVISEIALSLMLLIGAGLLLKSFIHLQEVHPGFSSNNLLLLRLSLPPLRYSNRESLSLFFEKVLPRIQNLPGVQSVSAANVLPLSALNVSNDFTVAGRPTSPTDMPSAQSRWISPGHFYNLGIPLMTGREFTPQDNPRSPGVVIINDALARRQFPNANPIGAHLKLDDEYDMEIVGVVGNVKHFGLDEQPMQTFYAPIGQIPGPAAPFFAGNCSLAIRTSLDPLSLESTVRKEIQAIDKDVPISNTRTMDQVLSTSTAPRRFNTLLLTIFAAASLLLAITGIYAVMSYSVAQRSQEIGIRMALGATPADVLKLILGNGFKLILIGVAAGLIGCVILTRFISTLLFAVSAVDPVTFAVASLILMLVAILACFVPALRATRLDPALTLRGE
jgi:putative ABC transport system permease protein